MAWFTECRSARRIGERFTGCPSELGRTAATCGLSDGRAIEPSDAAELLATIGCPAPGLDDAATIRRYAAVMRRGDWLDGGLIEIDASGRLVNGFHRCHAVIASGVAIRAVVAPCAPL